MLHDSLLIFLERLALILSMVISPNQGHKDATAINERSHNAMVLERECFEEIDPFRSPKLLNGDLGSGFSKHLPVIVGEATEDAPLLMCKSLR